MCTWTIASLWARAPRSATAPATRLNSSGPEGACSSVASPLRAGNLRSVAKPQAGGEHSREQKHSPATPTRRDRWRGFAITPMWTRSLSHSANAPVGACGNRASTGASCRSQWSGPPSPARGCVCPEGPAEAGAGMAEIVAARHGEGQRVSARSAPRGAPDRLGICRRPDRVMPQARHSGSISACPRALGRCPLSQRD
jgi:hypothetical protein